MARSIQSATLSKHVLCVALWFIEKQMIGSDAGWVVTAVADVEAIRNRAVSQLIGDAVGSGALAIDTNPSVVAGGTLGHP